MSPGSSVGAPVRRRGLWAELIAPGRVADPAVLRLLAHRGIDLYLAVTPESLAEAPRLVRVCQDHGVAISLWPMLSHADGRWACADNVGAYEGLIVALFDRLERQDAMPEGIAVDLEPSIGDLPRLLALDRDAILRRMGRPRGDDSVRRLAALCASIAERGPEPFLAVLPFVVSDGGGTGFQRFFGTPVDTLGVARVSAMVYTSMIEGYAGGFLSRDDLPGVVYRTALALRARYASPSLSLGCVGHGMLGDEPLYRTPNELSSDVAAARAAGVDDLVLFSLEGVIARPPAEAWLDAFVATEPAARVRVTPKARAILAATRTASVALEQVARSAALHRSIRHRLRRGG